MCLQANRTPAANAIGPLARHQLAMPAQNRVRRHDWRDLREHSANESVSQHSEASPLANRRSAGGPASLALNSRFSSRRNAMTFACSPWSHSLNAAMSKWSTVADYASAPSTCGTLRLARRKNRFVNEKRSKRP